MHSDWLGTTQVAQQLGQTPRTVYRLINRGELVGHRFGRVIRISSSAVTDYVNCSVIEPGTLDHLDPRARSGEA